MFLPLTSTETRNDNSSIVSVLDKQNNSLEAAALGSNVTLITLNSEGKRLEGLSSPSHSPIEIVLSTTF